MGVILPFFLFGLIALAIPIVIHLWSKNTKKSLPFGSIRFLQETETKTMKSIMPSQWLLLLTRLLLLGLLVLLLAEPFLKREPESFDTIFLVDTKYSELPWFEEWKDTLSEKDAAFWLSKDFPSIDEKVINYKNNYWSLLSNPPKLKTEKVVVISPLLSSNFLTNSKSFPINYEWIKLPVRPLVKSDFFYRKGEKSYAVKTTYGDWSVSNDIEQTSDGNPIIISYHMKVDQSYRNYERIFKSALNTLNELSVFTIQKVNSVEKAEWLIWLSDAEPIKHLNSITIDTSSLKKWNVINPYQVSISSDWQMEDALKMNLPRKLVHLFGGKLISDDGDDQRTMDTSSFTYDLADEGEFKKVEKSAVSYFWILLILGLILERWLSFKSEKQ